MAKLKKKKIDNKKAIAGKKLKHTFKVCHKPCWSNVICENGCFGLMKIELVSCFGCFSLAEIGKLVRIEGKIVGAKEVNTERDNLLSSNFDLYTISTTSNFLEIRHWKSLSILVSLS